MRVLSISVLLFAAVLLSASIASGETDPELKTCKHQCRAQQGADEGQIRVCIQKCEDYHREKQEREREKEHGGGGGGSGGRGVDQFNPETPLERLRDCEQRCQKGEKGQEEQHDCRTRCRQEYEREKKRHEGGGGSGGGGSGGRGVDQFNPETPLERLRDCEQRCQKGEKGQEEQHECRTRCRREYEREKKRREGGGGSGGGRDEFNPESPEERFGECRRECEEGRKGYEETRYCRQQCRERYEREREGGGSGGGGSQDNPTHRDPEKEYQKCRQQCRRESEGRYSQQKCESRCEEKRRQSEEQHGGGEQGNEKYEESEEEEEQQGESEENPYVFQDQHFTTRIQTEHGRVRVLQKFSDRSELLRGIENYRYTMLEAEPQTFIVPNHWDAEAVFFVARGRGTVSLIRSESQKSQKRESFNIRHGDIVRIPAGTTTYIINSDNNERLVIAKLLQPVSTPGSFETFFGAGGENPESYYRAFSTDILEAAFNTNRDRLQRIFGQQKQGAILKASREQIRAMSRHEEGGVWPFGGEAKGTINIFQQRPSQQNQYGQLYEVAPNDFRELQDLDVAVSFINLTQNGMAGPMYTSKATKIAVVVNGDGYFEMACPHLSSQQSRGRGTRKGRGGSEHQARGGPSYQKVSTRLRRGTVVIIPAGHPFVTVASRNQNLEMVCFEVNARNSFKFALAGKNNVVNQYEREAKELAFGVSAREVEEIFGSQKEEFFFKGPAQQHEGRAEE